MAWWSVALTLFGVAAAVQAHLGRGDRALELIGLLALTAAAPLLRYLEVRLVAALAVLGILVFTAAGLAILYGSTLRWMTSWDDGDRLRSLAHSTTATGTPQFKAAAFRRWELDSPSDGKQVSVDLNVLRLPPGIAWQSGVATARIASAADGAALIHFVSHDQFAFRSASLEGSLAGRRFEASITARSPDEGERCGYLYLGEHGARATNREHVCFTGTWSQHAVHWEAPSDSAAGLIDVILSGFDGPLEVKGVQISEAAATGDVLIGTLAPTGVTLRASWGMPFPWSRISTQERFVSTQPEEVGPTRIALPLPDGLPAGTRIWTTLHVEVGGVVEIVDTSWTAPGVRPVGTGQRLALWFDHPNLLAHAVSAIAVTAIGTLSSTISAVAVLAAAGWVIAFTGSRTALFALAVGAFVLVAARRQGRSLRHLGTIGAVVVPVILFIGIVTILRDERIQPVARVLVLDQPSITERLDIWGHAAALGRDHPFAGSPLPFVDSWRERYPSRVPVNHAHNGLLDMLSKYGLPGLLGALAAITAVVLMGWDVSRRRTAMAIGCLFVLNLADASYLSMLTLGPLLMLTLAQDRDDGARGSWRSVPDHRRPRSTSRGVVS